MFTKKQPKVNGMIEVTKYVNKDPETKSNSIFRSIISKAVCKIISNSKDYNDASSKVHAYLRAVDKYKS